MGAPTNTTLHVVAMRANGAIVANSVVKLDSTEQDIAATTAITDAVFGVALNTVADNEMVSIETGNGCLVKLRAGGSISIGDKLMPKAAGDGTVILAAGATAIDCGTALQAAASGEVFTARLNPMGKSPANS